MDFGALPPETNSGRMYTGPGSGSMLVAAAAWDGLAAQLRSTAASYASAISGLTAAWQGPSSAAMAAAANPYAGWMNATAAQAEQTAAQARAAATAYETAFTAMVPPPAIAANRALLASLSAANIFGQNTAAIAATEAQYAGMWAQDAAAMYGYAAQSAAASQVTPFASPPQTTDPGGPAAQSAAVAQAPGASLMSGVTSALQSLALPTAADPPSLQTLLTSLLPLLIGLDLFEVTGPASLPARNALVANTFGFGLAARGFQTGELPVPLVPGVLYPPVADLAAAESGASAVTAGAGRAGLVGALSVPPSWAAATPVVRLAASVLQGTGTAAVPLVATVGQGNVFGQMALSSLAGGALGNTIPRAATGTGARVAAPNAAGESKDPKTSDKLERVLAELSQNPESVEHWHTDKAHLEGLLAQLSMKPGVHAVHVSSRDKPNPVPHQPRWG
jgi:PPE-repeat protein